LDEKGVFGVWFGEDGMKFWSNFSREIWIGSRQFLGIWFAIMDGW